MKTFDRGKIRAIAIGGFDGIHRGHQQLFKELGSNGGILVIDTEHTNLTPKDYREKYVDFPVFYLDLPDILQLTPEEFIEMLKVRFPKLEKIVVGYDFRFGHKRSGEAKDIPRYFDGEVMVVSEVKVDGISVHSRTIRGYIRVGDMEQAKKLIGRHYSISGDVISGQGIGMRRLYPTLNLNVRQFLLPGEGVYATRTCIKGKRYDSVTFIGHRVTTDGGFSVETHILGEVIESGIEEADIEFVKKMRDNMMFAELEDLKTQISTDIAQAKEILKKD